MRSAFWKAAFFCLVVASTGNRARAETIDDRFDAAGYFRIMTRPDLQGGDGRLGFWNLYGRLLNEGPYAMLEMRLALLPESSRGAEPWTRVHARIEGGTIANSDASAGGLGNYRLTQLFVRAGNVLLKDVTWQLGTIEYFYGDLGLYDFRPAIVFEDTVGISGRWQKGPIDLTVGAGDAGFSIRGSQYSTIVNAGGAARLHLSDHFEVGFGGQYYFEPKVEGNRFAPYQTPNIEYDDFLRGEVVQSFIEDNPGQEDLFPGPEAHSSTSFKLVGYLGWGGFGPVRWNNLFINYKRVHPGNFVTEEFAGRAYDIYVKELTDERYRLDIGDEMQFSIVPDLLDGAWAFYYGRYRDRDNQIAAADNNLTIASTVLRVQMYLSQTTHLLAETSLAREHSENGNRYRNYVDSVFTSTNGISDPRGLEFGDSSTRQTWQGKFGVVLNPLGTGIYTRPSIRILYGIQHSSQNNAFGNSFVESLDDYNDFPNREQHLHHVVALEAETWF